MRRSPLRRSLALAAVLVTVGIVATAGAAANGVIATGLDNPRGIAVGPGHSVLVVESLTGEITKLQGGTSSTLATVPGAVDVAVGGNGQTYVVTGGAPPDVPAPPGARSLLLLEHGTTSLVADIGAYQQTNPDPYDIEDNPTESNPNGLALLGGGRVLVVDAATNNLLLVDGHGHISTVARFKPDLIPFPPHLPFGPPAGTLVPAEAVPTAVAVGPDGAWYVSELTGFPFTPGTSDVWRIEPGSTNAVCDPANPEHGACRIFARGFTSIMDLAFGPTGTMYVLELAKGSVLALEGGGEPTGALFAVKNGTSTEIAPGSLLAPGGVAVDHDGSLYVTTGTVFGPGKGAVVKLQG